VKYKSACRNSPLKQPGISGAEEKAENRKQKAEINLETAVQSRMHTDGHGYRAVATIRRFTWQVKDKPASKSVFIRVNPWLMTVLSNSNCGN
jgi:hypothetical protein